MPDGMTQRWTADAARAVHDLPFADLILRAQTTHRAHFDANAVQTSRLLSIKTGGCPEDCGYCSQSAHNDGVAASKLMPVEQVIEAAKQARDGGATRYCMGAAWRNPHDRDMDRLTQMVRGVKALGLETCMTLGMLSPAQAETLADAGLDYYNHNVDTSERFYPEIVTTRSYADRLDTLDTVRQAGMKLCCGGILGLGETVADRVDMLVTLANLPAPPDSVPINALIPMPGSKMAGAPPVDVFDFVRLIATARIMMPRAHVRLAAGRTRMSDEAQALCFLAGANSIFIGEKLLTAGNPDEDHDTALFNRLGLRPMRVDELANPA